MNEKLANKLCADFPTLYKGRHRTIQESLMPFGFGCGDGWYNIIYKLSEGIVALDKKVEATQVKEKFGGLRFYVSPTKAEVFDLINEAEEQSYKICEECGEKGKLREELPWMLTLCNKHYKKIEPDKKTKKINKKKAKQHISFKIRVNA